MAYDVLWKVHAVLMTISFLAITSGIVISIMKSRVKGYFRKHRALGLFGGITGLIALILAFVMVQLYGGGHFMTPHSILGGLAGLGLISVPILGLRMKKSKKRKALSIAHRALGSLTMLAMAMTIILGLTMTGILFL